MADPQTPPDGDSSAGTSGGTPGSSERRMIRRDRVRRRVRHHRAPSWRAKSSRRRTLRTVMVCVGVLLMMAGILYFGLSRQESGPAESLSPPAPLEDQVPGARPVQVFMLRMGDGRSSGSPAVAS
jgi:hypothetical protein